MSNKKGEIATIITLGSLVVLGVVSLVSSVFLKKTSPIKTKASEDCNQMANRSCVNYPPPPPPVVRGQNKQDSTGACNPACCECNEQCPNGQKCDIPNGYCKSGFSCNPATGKKLTCVSGQCVWQACQGEDCNKNTCTSHSDCQPQSSPPASPPPGGGGGGGGGRGVGNSCFNIKAEFEVRPEGDKKAFYSWVTFVSNKGGDIKLDYNGIHVAGWNNFDGGTFTYGPQWTQPHTHEGEAGIAGFSGKSHMPFTYTGIHTGCQPQDITLSCAVGINNQGPYVSGEGCSCRNCQQYQPPPPTRGGQPPPPQATVPRQATSASTPVQGQPSPQSSRASSAPGEEGGECLYRIEETWGILREEYYCSDSNLVCSKQDGTGICVTSTTTSTSTSRGGAPSAPGGGTTTPAATLTPTPAPGEEGGPCISSSEHIIGGYYHYYYSCDGNLVCSKQDGTGICVRPTPTQPKPTPKCNFKDVNYCVDYRYESSWNCGKSNNDFPCCQKADGNWVQLVKTGTYGENCFYNNQNNQIRALTGTRKVKREQGGQDRNYSCKYSIASNDNGGDIPCNYDGWERQWNPTCDIYCELPPNYMVTVKIMKNYFSRNYFGDSKPSNYDSFTIKVLYSLSDSEVEQTIEIPPGDDNLVTENDLFDIEIYQVFTKETLINYYNTWNWNPIILGSITIKTVRKKNEDTKTHDFSVDVILNSDDLTSVIE